MTTEETLRRFIAAELRREGGAGDLAAGASLVDEGIMDSLGIVKTIAFLEREFGLTVRDDEVLPRNFETIDAIAGFVRAKRGA